MGSVEDLPGMEDIFGDVLLHFHLKPKNGENILKNLDLALRGERVPDHSVPILAHIFLYELENF